MDLSTTYLGLELRSPLVVSASPLSEKIEDLQEMEDAGAAAVVLYSLFEEQMHAAGSVTPAETAAYLKHIAEAKRSVSIPIIASLNCTTIDGWITYARQITEAGADALELNIYKVPSNVKVLGSTIEDGYIHIVRAVRQLTSLPLAVKLSPYFSNFANMAHCLEQVGADGLVLFNRFYQPDIDLEKMEVTPNIGLSSSMDMRLPLRWIAILHGHVRVSLAATSGIHLPADVIKMVLAGADVTMLCSVLMRRGIAHIHDLEKEIVRWLQHHSYKSLSEIKGLMSQKNCADPSAFERAQYVRALSTYTPLFLQRK